LPGKVNYLNFDNLPSGLARGPNFSPRIGDQMVQRTVLTVFSLLLSFYAYADHNYYPQHFQDQLENGEVTNQELKEELYRILSQYHNPSANGPDSVGTKCKSDGCYRHTSVGYKQARRVLFGQIHLKQIKGEYAVQDVYCNKWLTESEFRSNPPAPGKIPNSQIVNAEHTWPQSKFSSRHYKSTQKSDIHGLYPTNSRANSSRGNSPLGNVQKAQTQICPASAKGPSTESGRSVFEPPTNHKGNAARALFYFAVRYQMAIDSEQEQFLRIWNLIDPVDEEEMRRNDIIFETQFNRNPFVDIEGLVAQIEDF
jgi:deoxyribonuclease-1